MTMKIHVIFDTVCPWSYIGKRRMEHALRMRPSVNAELLWRPFLLNREIPTEGIDRSAYLIRKFGSEARVRRVYGAIARAGESVDIDFAFDRIDRTPNSVDSHRLIQFAQENGANQKIVEKLFFEYFIRGADIGSKKVLCDIGYRSGLDRNAVSKYLDSKENIDFVYNENTRAHRMGVNGVPAFIFNEKMLISGAQEPQILARMIDAALATKDSGV